MAFTVLRKMAKSPKTNNGKTSHSEDEKELVQRAIDIVIEKNLEAFRELEKA